VRITFYSNAPFTPTGYGNQTRLTVARMAAAGHDVAVAANWGLSGTILEIDGIKIMPTGEDIYSNDIVVAHHMAWTKNKGWLITLYDVWPFSPEEMANAKHLASWVPVDHLPATVATVDYFRKSGAMPIAMSKFGQKMLQNAGFDARYVPHGIDLDVFKPTEVMESGGELARDFLKIPADAFLVTMNGKNKSERKAYGQAFQALGAFMRKRKDVYLYVHADQAKGGGGIDLLLLATACGMDLERVRWADRYGMKIGAITETDLAAIYTASDVFLLASKGEGFGIPVIESMACGTPAIVSDFSAQPELVEDTGYLVAGQFEWDAGQGAWWFDPSVVDMIRALEDSYAFRGIPEVGLHAIAKAAEYEVNRVFAESWMPILAEMEEALIERPIPLNRQQRRRQKLVAAR
jgi:glycosyltransferase involved in cell wall biosynthesis